ncbi:MAG: adenosylcobinamide-GDP ribazoletransferase [Tannerella sp.]|jgi:adenosylcobinamide-GDP ribazoletransferase|nr:adenosylcobinamide-GDP ribazoletransferase [Tannerella sp.]
MKRELNLFFTALRFYTRIPCPCGNDYPDDLSQSIRYFPLIGWIVGGIMTLVIYGLSFVFPDSVCILLSLAVGILITGAFHEDGFVDVCDGFGGGWTKEKILAIMKDSRIGAYGVIAWVVLFALKLFTLLELLHIDLLFCIKVLLLAQVISRFSVVTMVFTHQYARTDSSSKAKSIANGNTIGNLLISVFWLLPFLWLFSDWRFAFILIPVYLTKMCLAQYFKKWIGGYTGECLGATQQITEVVSLLFCLGVYRFI